MQSHCWRRFRVWPNLFLCLFVNRASGWGVFISNLFAIKLTFHRNFHRNFGRLEKVAVRHRDGPRDERRSAACLQSATLFHFGMPR